MREHEFLSVSCCRISTAVASPVFFPSHVLVFALEKYSRPKFRSSLDSKMSCVSTFFQANSTTAFSSRSHCLPRLRYQAKEFPKIQKRVARFKKKWRGNRPESRSNLPSNGPSTLFQGNARTACPSRSPCLPRLRCQARVF